MNAGLPKKAVFVATDFKVRRITCRIGDFNAEIPFMARYRKNTRISDKVDMLVLIKGCVKSIMIVPVLYSINRGCVGGL